MLLMDFLFKMKKFIITNINEKPKAEQKKTLDENKYIKLNKEYKYKSGRLYEEYEKPENQTFYGLSSQFSSNIDKYYQENIDELSYTSDLYISYPSGSIELNHNKEIVYCTFEEIKNIYNEFYKDFENELNNPQSNKFITELLNGYQNNFNLIANSTLSKFVLETKAQKENLEKHKNLNYSDYRKVGIEFYKHIEELHTEMKENFDKHSDLIVSNKIYNMLIQFYSEFKSTIEKMIVINKENSPQIFSHFKNIRDAQNLQKQIETSIKFIEIASENKLIFDSFTYKDHLLSPYLNIYDFMNFKEKNPNFILNYRDFKKNISNIYFKQISFSTLITSPSFYLDILLVNDHYYKKLMLESEKSNFVECFLLIKEWEKYNKNQSLMNDFTYLKLFVLRKLFEEKLAFDIYNNKIKIMNE